MLTAHSRVTSYSTHAGAAAPKLVLEPVSGDSPLVQAMSRLSWPKLLAHRPVADIALRCGGGSAGGGEGGGRASRSHLLVVAYAPVGAQLGAAQLLKVGRLFVCAIMLQ
jgi:hypothetical protein